MVACGRVKRAPTMERQWDGVPLNLGPAETRAPAFRQIGKRLGAQGSRSAGFSIPHAKKLCFLVSRMSQIPSPIVVKNLKFPFDKSQFPVYTVGVF